MSKRQRTLRDIAIIEGTGTLSGKTVRVEIHPAEKNHGPAFELTQDGSSHIIPVSINNAIEKENRTVLASKEDKKYQVHFVEHILAALHGLEIDNAVIKVDAGEVPLIDGSAEPYVKAIDAAGIIEQDADREELVIDEPMFIDDNGLLMVLPSDCLKISYYLYHPDDIIGKILEHIDVTEEIFRNKIGRARSFIKEEWIEAIVGAGDIAHMDESQVLIVTKDSVSQPLRFENEYPYHKMLDILGDFYLTGKRLRGHIIGVRSGHGQNRKMVRKMVAKYM